MKLNTALAKSLLMAASIGMVVPMVAQTAPRPPKSKQDKSPEPEPKIPGVVIPRGSGGFLGLEVAGGNFRLSFYDAKKKPAEPDVPRAAARWNSPRKVGEERAVLNKAGANALVGNKPVQPPFAFNVFLTLLNEDGSTAESHVVNLRELPGSGT